MYFGRYIYRGPWFRGMGLLLLVIAAAFLGYVLP